MKPLPAAAIALAFALAAGAAAAQPDRGALLYENHCGACHSEKMHWRDRREATDPASLRRLVRQWQAQAQLAWSDEDIDAVTAYLDRRFYRFAKATTQRSGANVLVAAQTQR